MLIVGAVTPRKPIVREHKRRAGKGRPSSLCPRELPADSGPPLGDFKNASGREVPTGRGGDGIRADPQRVLFEN